MILHPSLAESYHPQKRTFRRVISLLFSMAGLYWLAMYSAHLAGEVTSSTMLTLRNGQTVIYFVLLTLWGLEYLREARRLSAVITAANEHNTAPQHIDSEALQSQIGAFAIFRPIAGGQRFSFMTIFNIGGIITSGVLIGLQYYRLINAILE